MPIQRLNHAVLYVRDLERTRAFYTEALDFKVVNEIPGMGLFFQAPGSTNDHDLGTFALGDGAGPSQAGKTTVGLYHLAWEVDTLAELERLAGVLSERGALVGATDHSTTKSLYAHDPDGNEFEVAWLVPLDQIDAATTDGRSGLEPLDIAREKARYGADTLGGVGISRPGVPIMSPDTAETTETTSPVLQTVELGAEWPTVDPFLFCAHHDDAYPAGDDAMAPAVPVDDRDLGADFSGQDGWSMYHGQSVPGFPNHPHRGFETVTYVRKGLIDHSDSLGAAARFGRGDVQWLTAGQGIVHAEMFPLLERKRPNPLELFQIWLNLPAADKLVEPYFTMFWDEDVPVVHHVDADGQATDVTVIAGTIDGVTGHAPPPDSYASRADADVAILHLRLAPGARFTLPPAAGPETGRVLYVFEGDTARVADVEVSNDTGVAVRADVPVELIAGAAEVEILVLQGRPIGEPVARYGPFVMNTEQEIHQAFEDYRRTEFGGWPWDDDAPTHGRDQARFARHTDGTVEEPTS